MLKGWEIVKLIGLGEITNGTFFNVYVNKKLTEKLIYEYDGLRYSEDSRYFPLQIRKGCEVVSSILTSKEFEFEIIDAR